MDNKELFYCCKTGNLSRLRYLVEEKDVDLKIRDKWDSTPLYYACLCGHYDVVQYLLQNGVSCEANTFDGERCLYGALTDDIRHLLENFKVITAITMKRDSYDEFFRRAYETPEYSDVDFKVESENILAHRCILAYRCLCLRQHFLFCWTDGNAVDLRHLKIKAGIFKKMLQFLYLGEVSLNKSDITDFINLAKHFSIYSSSEVDEVLSRKEGSIIYLQARYSPQECFRELYISTLPNQLRDVDNIYEKPLFVDLKIEVKDSVFSCHKVFICGRCSYLQALVTDHFSETYKSSDGVQVITLHDIEPDIFSKILQYIYTDTVDLSPSNALAVLSLADMLILTGLKQKCATFAQEVLTVQEVVSTIKIARFYDLPRLENRCTKYIAEHLEEVISLPDFQELVKSDALEIKNRQETDTIPIIDDIRYNIDCFLPFATDHKKHFLINQLLKNLNLEA